MNARCARCDRPFVQRRSDHRFCGPVCRKLGERAPWEGPAADPEAVDRLFDESRDPNAICRPDDWYPHPMTEFEQAIYLVPGGDTVASRRRLFFSHHPSDQRASVLDENTRPVSSRRRIRQLPPAA
jgi:hypothetical protein